MDIQLREQYSEEDMRWETTGAAKALAVIAAVAFAAGFVIWYLMTMLFAALPAA